MAGLLAPGCLICERLGAPGAYGGPTLEGMPETV